MPERGFRDRAKEIVKKGGILAAVAGGIVFLVSSSGLALAFFAGGTAAYVGARSFEKNK